MNKHIIWCLAVALAVSAGCKSSGAGGAAKEKHEKISQSALPQAVRDGFTKEHPGATITEVEKETYPDGTVHYEIGYRAADGKEHDVELNADGDVLDAH
jgi:uncharacterized membrane protein YkoI